MNHNEEFKRNLLIKLIDNVEINFKQQQIIEGILVELLQDYTVSKIETALTVSDIPEKVTMYLQAKRLEGLSNLTLKNYFYLLRRLAAFSHKQVKDINLNDLRTFLFQECEGLKETTMQVKVTYLQSFFKWLVDEDIIDKDPSRKLPRIRVPQRLRSALTIEEVEKLRMACTDVRERAILEMLLATGCRLSELVGMNTEDLNSKDNSIRVIGKGNKERIVFFNPRTKVHLDKYLETKKGSSEALFVGSRKPYNRLGNRAVEKVINKIATNAGFDKAVFPHLFRHTMASLGLQAGANIVAIQSLLGHSSVTTTERYAQNSIENVKHEYNQNMIL